MKRQSVCMMFSLEGCGALITGGSGAIGRAIALKLAEQGASVAICGTRPEALTSVLGEIEAVSHKKAVALRCDLSDATEASKLVGMAEEAIGSVDILVNNAGINRDMLFTRMSEEDFDAVLAVNLKAAFILTKAAVVAMASRRFGRIINISSVVGFTGNIGQANYCASKAALTGMSKAIALEYARRGVTVNCIAPGAIESPMTAAMSEQARDKFLTKIPMCRIGAPEDVAAACCYLASREAAYVTGQTLHVNGGMW